MLVAFCPMAYFFSAVYSESLFLALSVGCILQARMGRWAWAGVLGAIGAASRNSGVMLVVPIVLLFLYGPRADRPPSGVGGDADRFAGWRRVLPRYPVTPAIAWAGLVPLGLGAYIGWLALKTGHGLAPFHAQQVWFRHFAGPFGGVWTGAVAAWDGLRQLLHGPPPPLYFDKAGGDPMKVAGPEPAAVRVPGARRGRDRRDAAAAADRLRRLLPGRAGAADLLSGDAAAAGLAAPLRGGAVPDLHVGGDLA